MSDHFRINSAEVKKHNNAFFSLSLSVFCKYRIWDAGSSCRPIQKVLGTESMQQRLKMSIALSFGTAL